MAKEYKKSRSKEQHPPIGLTQSTQRRKISGVRIPHPACGSWDGGVSEVLCHGNFSKYTLWLIRRNCPRQVPSLRPHLKMFLVVARVTGIGRCLNGGIPFQSCSREFQGKVLAPGHYWSLYTSNSGHWRSCLCCRRLSELDALEL